MSWLAPLLIAQAVSAQPSIEEMTAKFEELKSKTAAFIAAVEETKGPRPEPKNGIKVGSFVTSVEKDAMDDSQWVTMTTVAIEPSRSSYKMTLQCEDNSTMLRINAGTPIRDFSPRMNYVIRVGDNQAIEFNGPFTPSREGFFIELALLDDLLFSESAEGMFGDQPLVMQLITGNKLRIRMLPANAEPKEISFSLAGYNKSSWILNCEGLD